MLDSGIISQIEGIEDVRDIKGVVDFDQIDDDFSSSLELGEVLTRAQANDWIVNYWS